MPQTTDALIIREYNNIGEADRFVAALTRDLGLIRASARGARNIKSRNAAATQLLAYSRLSLVKGRDKYIINDAQPLEVFFDLRSDIETLSLAQYFCELVSVLAPEEAAAGDLLRLVLNALHFLAKRKRPSLIIKAAVEMRMLSLAGYMPDLICCQNCAVYEADDMVFLPKSGVIYCGNCYHPTSEFAFHMGKGVMTGLRHTIYADFDKLFSFQLQPEGQKQLAQITEQYMLQTLERRFMTLDFYHQVADMK